MKASAPPGGLTAAAIEVKETEFGLEPAEITLNKPGVYVFKAENTGNLTHVLTIRMVGTETATETTWNPVRATNSEWPSNTAPTSFTVPWTVTKSAA